MKLPAICFYDGINDNGRSFLSNLRADLISESGDVALRDSASFRNKSCDFIGDGFLVHGCRNCSFEKLESIINNGLFCPEFVGSEEDGETFYHLDLFEMPKLSGLTDLIGLFSDKLGGFFPVNEFCKDNIGFVVNPRNVLGKEFVYVGDKESVGNYEYRGLINTKCIPLPFRKGGLNHVAVLGGVPSNSITGLIVHEKLAVKPLVSFLEDCGLYLQVYTTNGKKVY